MSAKRTGKFRMVRMLAAASTFALAGIVVVSGAHALDLGGSLGSGGNSGSVGGSIGGGSASAGGSASGPSGTTGSGGVSIGGGSGISASSTSRTTGNTRTNFTSAFNRNNTTGTGSIGIGDTTLGLGFGSPGAVAPGTTPGTAVTSRSIAAALRELSPQEQRKLAKKCISILAAPQRYGSDAVAVCRVLASL
jgi:hypothetical protein